jgi:hypothetical protein
VIFNTTTLLFHQKPSIFNIILKAFNILSNVSVCLRQQLIIIIIMPIVRTFDHDHVNINGADVRMQQSFTSLQHLHNVTCSHILKWPLAEGEYLPQCYTCHTHNTPVTRMTHLSHAQHTCHTHDTPVTRTTHLPHAQHTCYTHNTPVTCTKHLSHAQHAFHMQNTPVT